MKQSSIKTLRNPKQQGGDNKYPSLGGFENGVGRKRGIDFEPVSLSDYYIYRGKGRLGSVLVGIGKKGYMRRFIPRGLSGAKLFGAFIEIYGKRAGPFRKFRRSGGISMGGEMQRK